MRGSPQKVPEKSRTGDAVLPVRLHEERQMIDKKREPAKPQQPKPVPKELNKVVVKETFKNPPDTEVGPPKRSGRPKGKP